ncbi:MAG TPA: NAD(P)-dependent oxidoreductase [Conexibacter sp.]|nr:NAD(P)-dependent oxidoreductase [Conexibacter sp.]
MTVLVTGGTGLLGRAVLERLAGEQEVVALHRPASAPPPIAGVTWLEQDLAAPLRPDLPARVAGVLHLAQSRRHREFPAGAVDTFAINAMATVRLLDYCDRAGGERFVLASSGAIYGPGPAPLREEDAPDPPSFYGQSKLAAERAADEFRARFAVAILRFFFVYGPGQDAGAFVPGLVTRVREGRPIDLQGTDGMRCNPIHVEEAAAASVAAWHRGDAEAANVAGPEIVTLRRIGERLGELVGIAPRFVEHPASGDLVADTARMRARLLTPRIGLGEGLERMLSAQTPKPS